MKFYLFLISLVLMLSLVSSASLSPATQNECKVLEQTCNNCTFVNITKMKYGNDTVVNNLNWAMTKIGVNYNYTFCGTQSLGEYTFTTLGNPDGTTTCNTCSEEVSFLVTPTGKVVDDVGQISSSILYFYVILGFGLIGLGYLFLRSENVFTSYSGLFLMLVGGAFIYYDLHLSNLYATTVAVNSGAGNTTTGGFTLIANFLKLAPYIVAGIVGFASVKLLRGAINKKKSSDGWDNDKY
jgi:hypothetical protein